MSFDVKCMPAQSFGKGTCKGSVLPAVTAHNHTHTGFIGTRPVLQREQWLR